MSDIRTREAAFNQNSAHQTERVLASIWSEVLGVSEIAPEDNFIELGGDSVAATLCVHRLHGQVSVELPIALLLEANMTLRSLAALIERSLAASPLQPFSDG